MRSLISKIVVFIIIGFLSLLCYSNEIYKTIDKDGNITFSSFPPHNSKIVKTVTVKKLIKKLSVINGASEQNKKIKALAQELRESRIKRDKEKAESTENYNKEISLIKNQRLEGLTKLSNESALNANMTNKEQLKDSISKMLTKQK